MTQKTWRMIATIVAILILGAIIYFFGIKPIAQLNQMKSILETKDYLQLRNNVLGGLAQALGGAILLIGLFFTWRNVRATEANIRATQKSTAKSLAIAQEGLLTDRFARAIEQLGNQDSLATRLGGIFTLEQIAKDSKEYYKPIVELLTAFVRQNSPYAGGGSDETQKPAIDIQTILIVLGRRTRFSEDGPENPLNLIATNLRLLTLIDCHFEHAIFARSNLQGAFFSGGHFEKASFTKCNMNKAVLENAYLEDAIFINTSLEGANLFGVHGEKANFVMAQAQETYFIKAHLKGARFMQAKLKKAYFDEADLRGANFMRADLQEADLTKALLIGADLVGANLSDANIEGADLTNVTGLTLEQLKTTYGYGKATLPDHLKLAVKSEEETEQQG